MSLKYKYIFFIGLLHAILVVLAYFLLVDNKLWFLASEVLILGSLYLSYELYKGFIRPISLMQSGTDAIADGDFNIKYVKTGSKEIDQLIETYNTMINQLREERRQMTEQSYFVQNLIEVTPIGIIIMDYDGKLSNVNPSAQKTLRIRDKWQGKSLAEYPSDLVYAILKMEVGQSKMIVINGVDQYKCQINEVIHQGFKRQFILIHDLSVELIQSEKEAYGRIIRMMAHEVNNGIGAINSIIDTVVEFGFDDPTDPSWKESLVIAMERNQGLNQFMANYASILRLPEPQLQKVDLTEILKKCGQLYHPKAKELDISITFESPKHPVYVKADKLLMEQAISNMVKNAIEAISTDGDIRIVCNESPAEFIIYDNGTGVSKQVEQKLFTPFFSTKPQGQGIGLMIIRDILQSHKTDFSLKTDHESGWTAFSVKF